MLEAEISGHLGYERNEATGRNSGYNRNGNYTRKTCTSGWDAKIDVPRDHNGEYESQLLKKYTSESGGSFYLHTKDGWVWMPEGRFPEFIGHWMKKLDLAGPGDPTHIPRGPASLNFRFFLPGL